MGDPTARAERMFLDLYGTHHGMPPQTKAHRIRIIEAFAREVAAETWREAQQAADALKDQCQYCGAMSDEFNRRATQPPGRG